MKIQTTMAELKIGEKFWLSDQHESSTHFPYVKISQGCPNAVDSQLQIVNILDERKVFVYRKVDAFYDVKIGASFKLHGCEMRKISDHQAVLVQHIATISADEIVEVMR